MEEDGEMVREKQTQRGVVEEFVVGPRETEEYSVSPRGGLLFVEVEGLRRVLEGRREVRDYFLVLLEVVDLLLIQDEFVALSELDPTGLLHLVHSQELLSAGIHLEVRVSQNEVVFNDVLEYVVSLYGQQVEQMIHSGFHRLWAVARGQVAVDQGEETLPQL